MNKLTKEAEKVLDVVKKFRCASIEQLATVINDPKIDTSKVVHFLAIKQYVDIINEEYVTVRKHAQIKTEDIDCLWVVIDNMMYEEEFDYDAFKCTQTFQGSSNKIRLSFIKDNKYIVNVAYVGQYNIMDARFLQNRFFELTGATVGEEKEKGIVHYFVTRDPKMVQELKKMELKIPYLVVLLDYSQGKRPSIEYKK